MIAAAALAQTALAELSGAAPGWLAGLAGSALVAGDLTLTAPPPVLLAAALAGSSASAAAVTNLVPLAAASAGTASLTALLGADNGLAAAIGGAAVAAGDLTLTAQAIGQSAASVAAIGSFALGELAFADARSGAWSVRMPGGATLTGTLTLPSALAASLAGDGRILAELLTAQPGVAALAAGLAGGAALGANLGAAVVLGGDLVGGATIGAILVGSGLVVGMSGTAQCEGRLGLQLRLAAGLAGSAGFAAAFAAPLPTGGSRRRATPLGRLHE